MATRKTSAPGRGSKANGAEAKKPKRQVPRPEPETRYLSFAALEVGGSALAIRLVERRSGHTEVRSLRDDEVARLSGYLHDEGTLGDFVYSGALDG